MAAIITEHGDPTLAAADRALEERANSEPGRLRPHMGCSGVGQKCARRVWSSFRWVDLETLDAASIKRFEDGHAGEAMQAARLRLVPGLTLSTETEDGKQHAVVDPECPHLRGSMDGIIKGLLQSPRTAHVWEHKQVNEKKQAALRNFIVTKGEKDALEAWDYTYFAQAQLYMQLGGFERHYLTCSSPGGRETVSVRTERQPVKAKAMLSWARGLVSAAHPPERMPKGAFECKWCPFAATCQEGNVAPLRNCRTCIHSTPELDGTWSCGKLGKTLTVEEQRAGCGHQRWIPGLLPLKQVDVAPDGAWIEYETPGGGRWRDQGATR